MTVAKLRRSEGSERLRDKPPTSLSERERRFVEAYMSVAAGNATKAAIVAGYSPNTARKQGSRLLTKGHIRAAVEVRAHSDPRVATRDDLQRWWTSIVQDPDVSYRERLKASELLARSQAVFVDRLEQKVTLTLEDALTQSRAEPYA